MLAFTFSRSGSARRRGDRIPQPRHSGAQRVDQGILAGPRGAGDDEQEPRAGDHVNSYRTYQPHIRLQAKPEKFTIKGEETWSMSLSVASILSEAASRYREK